MKQQNKNEAGNLGTQQISSHWEQRLGMPLPCPFCGGNDIRFDEHGPMFVQIGERMAQNPDTIWSTCCYDCGAMFPNRRSKEQLVKCWNRRPDLLPNV
jgi:Lar family restriction alleviation protein